MELRVFQDRDFRTFRMGLLVFSGRLWRPGLTSREKHMVWDGQAQGV